jgi:hypothetical protein
MKKLLSISIISILTINISAWEVDNITNRKKLHSFSDSQKLENLYSLNDQTNRLLIKATERMNEKTSCISDMKKDIPSIYRMVRRTLGGAMNKGTIDHWAESNNELHTVKGNKNLYGGKWELDSSLNLNGHIVGSDKFGHFFDQGHEIFEIGYQSGEEGGLKELLSFNNVIEDMHHGISSTQVKSYGDMAANYGGMKFYVNLIHGKDSFLKCNKKTGKYEVKRDFDWNEFIDNSWDEGINCSKFFKAKNPYSKWGNFGQITSNTESGIEYKKTLKKMNLSCPVEIKKCKELSKLKCSAYFVSPDCLEKVGSVNSTCDHLELGEYNVPRTKTGYSYKRSSESNSRESNESQQ